ncbi:GDP-fucose protein O-fucosyltransferase [Artemisia annua]|uniref:GDP-fucose protein O-fucosyltransferase n=1 Tax=Artemisia annua TaxID=35608 RepID=A0A2U1MMY5_ARTAN|nr:GDP-fucose protein O-fucosyltransferase [Artemisia annua]
MLFSKLRPSTQIESQQPEGQKVFNFTPKKKSLSKEDRVSGIDKRMYRSTNSILNKARTQFMSKQRMMSRDRNAGHYASDLGDDLAGRSLYWKKKDPEDFSRKIPKGTLIIPDIRGAQPGDWRNFGDIYDIEKFVNSLDGVVKVVKTQPSELLSSENLVVLKVPNRVTEDYIADNIEPAFKSKGMQG